MNEVIDSVGVLPLHETQDINTPSEVPFTKFSCIDASHMSSTLRYVHGIKQLVHEAQCNFESESKAANTIPNICDIIAFSPPLKVMPAEDTLPKNWSLDSKKEVEKNTLSDIMNFSSPTTIQKNFDPVNDDSNVNCMIVDNNSGASLLSICVC